MAEIYREKNHSSVLTFSCVHFFPAPYKISHYPPGLGFRSFEVLENVDHSASSLSCESIGSVDYVSYASFAVKILASTPQFHQDKVLPSISRKMKMNRDLFVTVTVAVGAFLQGWVYALLIGYPSFMMNQLHLDNGPIQDSLVWLVSTIGVLLAVLSGKRGGIGRRPLLIFSSMLYLFSSIVMPLSGNVTLILVAKFFDGFATGFSYILLIFYFMETSHGRFLRYLLPQFVSLCGLCLSSVVGSWELMFNIAFSLSVLYFILVVFCLPESPKWLVRKGRIEEARHVLQKLRGTQDVSDEMYVLIFSVRLETATSIEDLNGGNDDLEYGPQDVSSEDLSKPAILDTASITSQDATLAAPLLTTTSTNAADASVLTTRAPN